MSLTGYHLIVDGLGRTPSAWTRPLVVALLVRLVDLAAMKLIAGPAVYEHQNSILGIAVLAESHATCHLDKETGVAYSEVFSCKPFDQDEIREAVVKGLNLAEHRARFVLRSHGNAAIIAG